MLMTNQQNYTTFIENHPLCDFQQSIEWGKVKEYWKNEIIVLINEKQEIIASVSILIRKIPFFGNLIYVPRGPIGDLHDKEIIAQLTQKIRELAKQYKAFVIKIEPNIEKSDLQFQEIVRNLGYKVNSTAMKFEEEIQARHNFRLFLKGKTEEEVFQNFSSKTRYNIRLAKRKGVEIKKIEKEEGIDLFYQLLEETAKRDNFRIRTKEYFIKLMEEMGDDKIELYFAFYQGEAIAGIMPITFGKKMWYLYGASGNQYRNTMPNYLLQWTAIQTAIQKKLELYDFRGVSMEEGKPDGLYHFKKSFGAELVELIGEIYIPFKPRTYRLYQTAEKQFRKIRYYFYQKARKREEKNLKLT